MNCADDSVRMMKKKHPALILPCTIKQMLREEGLRVFLLGSGPRVAKRALQMAITWSIVEEVTRRLGSDGWRG